MNAGCFRLRCLHRVCIDKFRTLGELNGLLLHNNYAVLSCGQTCPDDRKSSLPFVFQQGACASLAVAPMRAHGRAAILVPSEFLPSMIFRVCRDFLSAGRQGISDAPAFSFCGFLSRWASCLTVSLSIVCAFANQTLWYPRSFFMSSKRR